MQNYTISHIPLNIWNNILSAPDKLFAHTANFLPRHTDSRTIKRDCICRCHIFSASTHRQAATNKRRACDHNNLNIYSFLRMPHARSAHAASYNLKGRFRRARTWSLARPNTAFGRPKHGLRQKQAFGAAKQKISQPAQPHFLAYRRFMGRSAYSRVFARHTPRTYKNAQRLLTQKKADGNIYCRPPSKFKTKLHSLFLLSASQSFLPCSVYTHFLITLHSCQLRSRHFLKLRAAFLLKSRSRHFLSTFLAAPPAALTMYRPPGTASSSASALCPSATLMPVAV